MDFVSQPITQVVSKTRARMDLGSRSLEYWVTGPSDEKSDEQKAFMDSYKLQLRFRLTSSRCDP